MSTTDEPVEYTYEAALEMLKAASVAMADPMTSRPVRPSGLVHTDASHGALPSASGT